MTLDREPLWVLGGGGHGKVVLSLLRLLDRPVAGILDDDDSLWGTSLLGMAVDGPLGRLAGLDSPLALIAIGNNAIRKEIVCQFPLVRWFSAVHPRAFVDPSAEIGPGAVVFAGAIVQAEARIGAHVIVNTGATVDHDCRIGDFAHLCPGVHLAGEVQVGEGCLLGTGTSVIPGRSIGSQTVVGAGAAVVTDLPEAVTAIGVPARVRRDAFRREKTARDFLSAGDCPA